MYPFGVRVDVLSTTRDEHGDTTTILVGAIDGCAVAPVTSTEDTDQRAQVDTIADLFVPPTAVSVTAQSRIRLADGTVWRVDGTPQWWSNPYTGWSPGAVVRISRVTG